MVPYCHTVILSPCCPGRAVCCAEMIQHHHRPSGLSAFKYSLCNSVHGPSNWCRPECRPDNSRHVPALCRPQTPPVTRWAWDVNNHNPLLTSDTSPDSGDILPRGAPASPRPGGGWLQSGETIKLHGHRHHHQSPLWSCSSSVRIKWDQPQPQGSSHLFLSKLYLVPFLYLIFLRNGGAFRNRRGSNFFQRLIGFRRTETRWGSGKLLAKFYIGKLWWFTI